MMTVRPEKEEVHAHPPMGGGTPGMM